MATRLKSDIIIEIPFFKYSRFYSQKSLISSKLYFDFFWRYPFISGFTTRVQPQDHSATDEFEFSLRSGSVYSVSVNPIFLGAKSQIKKRSNWVNRGL